MPQRIAPFNFGSAPVWIRPRVAPEQKDLTAKPGGVLLAELFHASGCAAADETGVRSDRGYSDAGHVLSPVLLNTLGFDPSDDLKQLRSDGALVSAINLVNEYQGKERRAENVFSSPSAYRSLPRNPLHCRAREDEAPETGRATCEDSASLEADGDTSIRFSCKTDRSRAMEEAIRRNNSKKELTGSILLCIIKIAQKRI